MNIAGRMARERERMLGMSDEERAWRKRFLKHQILVDEPVTPPNYYKLRYNPIKRFFRFPMDMFQKAITPIMGPSKAELLRMTVSTMGRTIFFAYYAFYYIKYNTRDWTQKGAWRFYLTRPAVLPGDKDFPKHKHVTDPKEFYTLRFEKSPI